MCIALSKFAERCPLEVSNIQQGKGMDNVLDKMFQLMAFDPFYNNDDSDDDDSEEEDEGDDDDDDEDEDDDEDDDDDDDDEDEDDASWRVRRQALRVVRAFIQSRPEMLSTMYRRCVGADGGEGAGTLVSRFSERHDQVRVEIIMAVRELFEKSTMRHRALLTINANSALSEVAKDQALRTLKVRVYVVLFFIMVCVVVVWVVWNTVVVGAVCRAPSLLMFLLPFFALKWSSASRAHKLLRQRSDHIVLSDRSSAIMHEVEKILTNKTILKYKKHHVIVRELLVMLKEWLLALGGQMPNAGQWVTTTGSVNVLVRSGVCQGLLRGLLLLSGTVTFCQGLLLFVRDCYCCQGSCDLQRTAICQGLQLRYYFCHTYCCQGSYDLQRTDLPGTTTSILLLSYFTVQCPHLTRLPCGLRSASPRFPWWSNCCKRPTTSTPASNSTLWSF
jgi:hypothetical protein